MKSKCWAGLVMVLFALPVVAQEQTPGWEQRLAERHEQLITQNGPGTNTDLAAKLLAMRDDDQDARGFANGQPKDREKLTFAPNLAAIDRKLTAELKEIVAKHGWPTIHLVGYDASNGAMLVLTHSADHTWQRELLPKLETLAANGKIDGSQLALVVDKQLVAAGKLQRYGSQFKFVDGQAMMYAVEDPATLDARREKAMLMPMAVYRQRLGDIYHLTVSDVIVRADVPK